MFQVFVWGELLAGGFDFPPLYCSEGAWSDFGTERKPYDVTWSDFGYERKPYEVKRISPWGVHRGG